MRLRDVARVARPAHLRILIDVTAPRTIVVVGASLAGASAAFALREEGFDGTIVLIGDEPELPYERPPLSKKYLSGDQPFEKALVRSIEQYDEHAIDLELGAIASRINTRERSVELTDGRSFRADRVLIATGARNRRPPIPGLDLAGIYDLRTRADADRLRAELVPGRRAVVVGLGFIGSEVAATMRGAGLEVIGIEVFAVPLEPVLGSEIGSVLADLHREHGVELLLGDGVQEFVGDRRVKGVRTNTGRIVECDFAVVGLGVSPSIDLAESAGLELDNGIVVDELCRTSIDGILAAGDVANHFHPVFGERVRVEHWLNAIEQGAAAARTMLGGAAPYSEMHWFWSDQYDANLQYAGHHREWDELVVRGSLEERRFVAFYMKDAVPQAAVALNMARDLRRSIGLLRARRRFEPAALRDSDTDLRTLAPG
jgi:3-phenylpropionate/trans-cinnamate dioxygenase ferredoxin reductase component